METEVACYKCSKPFSPDNPDVTCDLCEKSYHQKCEKVSNGLYEVMKDPLNSSICWFCTKCKAAAVPIHKQLASFRKQQEEFQEKLNKLDNQKANKEDIKGEVLSVLEDDDTMHKISRVVTTKLEKDGIENTVQQIARETLEDINDSEKRKNNIIVYGLKERAEDEENPGLLDRREVEAILSHLDNIQGTDIETTYRLGKKSENKKRPIIIAFKTGETRDRAMRNLNKLQGSKWSKEDRISISYDFTSRQRTRHKEMIEKEKAAKKEEEREDFLYRIRGKPRQERVVVIKKKPKEDKPEDQTPEIT